jgi:DNA repair protein REV1
MIFSKTGGCCASIGIGNNMLMARLATNRAKPNNVYFVDNDEIGEFMEEFPIRSLPGIGFSIETKLNEQGLKFCGELRNVALKTIQKHVGDKNGLKLYDYCRGVDSKFYFILERVLENKPRQSVGAEINFGIRFENNDQVCKFIKTFCDHVYARYLKSELSNCAVDFHVVLKAKKRDYG